MHRHIKHVDNLNKPRINQPINLCFCHKDYEGNSRVVMNSAEQCFFPGLLIYRMPLYHGAMWDAKLTEKHFANVCVEILIHKFIAV
jgi:hypothetical protein